MMGMGQQSATTGKYLGVNPKVTKATTAFMISEFTFPRGVIIPYTGDLVDIPESWVLCDGKKGIVDLSKYFVDEKRDKDSKVIGYGLAYVTQVKPGSITKEDKK